MLLIEYDGKALLREFGIDIPPGVTAADADPVMPPGASGPWIVKAQVAVGGRGKAGGVVRCDAPPDVGAALGRMLGSHIHGHPVRLCLIENAVSGEEAYLSIMIEGARGGLRVMYSDKGGVDIESAAGVEGALLSQSCHAEPAAVEAAIARIAQQVSPERREPLRRIGSQLARLFFERELMFAEINPLFWTADGPFAGDAKIAIDLNAVDRQPALKELVLQRPSIYVDGHRKIVEGFDYIEIDPEGSIGLLTTGAGLSMMLIDELTVRNGSPINFCDVRTGQLRGSSDRLVRILGWLSQKPNIKVALINIFAGITDLAEFARLLVEALDRQPDFSCPLVVRLVGNGEAEALRILSDKRPDILVLSDLDEAMTRAHEWTADDRCPR